MSVAPDEFRALLGRFATGVTVLTARDAAGADHGMTVSAFSSASLTPPLVLVCIARDAEMYGILRSSTRFGISVLGAGQEALSRRFAELAEGRFGDVPFSRGDSGVALLDGAVGWLECERMAWHEAGDHAICLGEVLRATVGADTEPLVYFRGAYARLAP